jgi:hypothetical protein
MTERERLHLVARIFDLTKDLIRALLLGWIFWTIYLDVRELAGKQTDASFFFKYFVSKENDYALPWLVAVVTIAWALLERRFRKHKTQQLTARLQEMERRLDPKRSTSGLMPTGDTNPKDRIL